MQREAPAGEFAGRTAVVVGLGPLSGVAAAKALAARGARVIVNDARDADALTDQITTLKADQSSDAYEFALGSHPTSLARRADLMVLSPGVPYDLPMLRAAREEGVPTVGELEFAWRLGEARVIAVTGTKGKSTTTTLIGAMLDGFPDAGSVTVGGNIGLPLTEITPRLTRADSLVAEVSSFQLESVVDFRPDVAVVLNISPDHLDRHGTMDAYTAAKMRVVENQTADDLLVVNADDPATEAFARATSARVARFSLQRPVPFGAFLEGRSIVWARNGSPATVCRAESVRVPGRHNLANALAATTVARALGVPEERIEVALTGFHGLDHAYEVVADVNGVTYVDDSKATNLAAVKAAVEAACASTGRVVLILGGVDKGNRYEELLPTLRSHVTHAILLGPDVDRLVTALTGVVPFTRAGDMDEAVAQAAEVATNGVVLMSPGHASFDLYTNWKERGHAFQRAVRSLGPADGATAV